MADKKISALTAATTPLAGTEVLPIVQGGSTVQVSIANVTAGRAVAATDIVASGEITSTTNNARLSLYRSAGTNYFDWASGQTLAFGTQTSQGGAGRVSKVNFLDSGDLTNVTGNFVVGTAGKGIDFSANTHAAGMTSELLNWYETGTWTGGISFGGGSTGITYANNAGYYTRVGNLVTVSCYLVLSNKGSSTGAARITGLPFTCVNNAAGYSALSVLPLNVTFTGQLSGYANINDTTIDLIQSTGIALNDVGFANNSTFIISLTYRAA